MFFRNNNEQKINENKSVAYYIWAANQGDASSQFHLGYLYENGEDVPQNARLASMYYTWAANQGHMEAQYNLGLMYAYGQGIPKDLALASVYCTLAANQGHMAAQFRIGYMYAHGEGVPKNEGIAVHYYQLAADQGDASAQHNLGLMYANGRGVQKNKRLAANNYKLAADQGHVNACHALSIRYSIGYGVEQNLDKAQYYHHMATCVEMQDAFRSYKYSRNSTRPLLIDAPSLLLKIYDKTQPEQGLYKYVFSPQVELNKSYIPGIPPLAKKQRGPTCGMNALEMGLTWGYPDSKIPPARKNPIKPTRNEKRKNRNIVSLRKIAKEFGSRTGAVYDMHCLQKTAQKFGFECNIIKMKEEDRAKYTEQVRKTIQSGYSVILPSDIDVNGFPDNKQGKSTHYGLAWGYIYKNNQYHFLVAQYGKHYLWSADSLQKSHEQLPDINPRTGFYYINHEKDDYLPIVSGENIPATDIRWEPPSDLKNFKFTTVAIPTREKNFLSLDTIENIVKSSDAIILKLLAEKGTALKNFSTLKKNALKNRDEMPEEMLTCIESSCEKLSLNEKRSSSLCPRR